MTAKVANSSGWNVSTIDKAGEVGLHTSIAIDSNNKVHISYYDLINGDLKYVTNAPPPARSNVVDFDGDARTDIAVWRPGDGYYYILNSSSQEVTQTQWGTDSFEDTLVPGDYDGDGKTDIAIWRPGDGYWYILGSQDGVVQIQWGTGSLNDIPTPGDYDGDGRTDIAVWRPGDGYWHILESSNGGVTQTQWGQAILTIFPSLAITMETERRILLFGDPAMVTGMRLDLRMAR
ncbi:MAG: FG-GAP repeat domain-containing protein [Thermodesulfobacteriota bacterium]